MLAVEMERAPEAASAMDGRIHGEDDVRDIRVHGKGHAAPFRGPGRGVYRASRLDFGRGGAPVTTLDANLRLAVLAYLKRSGLSGLQFGQMSIGNPGFVLNLDRRRSLSLDVADRVLRFMGEPPIGPMFRREVEAFLEVTGTGPASLGLKAAGDAAFVQKLRQGTYPRLSTVQRVRAWMRETANEAESAAIARTLAGSAEAAATLAPDPAALRALVERRSRPISDDTRPSAPDEPTFLTTRQAAAFLSLSPRTLDRYRVAGKGPPFHKLGTRIAYARADLEEWGGAKRRRGPPKTI